MRDSETLHCRALRRGGLRRPPDARSRERKGA